jgi:hypothetical protein
MLTEIEQILKARKELLIWWEEFQQTKDSEPETKLQILVDGHQMEAFFSTINNLTVMQVGAHSRVLSSMMADYVRENSDIIVREAYQRALSAINTKLAEAKVELQKLLESI